MSTIIYVHLQMFQNLFKFNVLTFPHNLKLFFCLRVTLLHFRWCGKWRSVTQSHGEEQYPTYNKQQEG